MAINISTRDHLDVSNEAKSRFRKSAAASAVDSLEEQRCAATANATEHATAAWTTQQALEAIILDDTPKYLLRDNDAIYGNMFRQKVAVPGLVEVTVLSQT